MLGALGGTMEIVDRCTRQGSVYVLSAVHRERAAERLRVRIERLEGRLRPMVERIEKSLSRDPLEAFARLREAGRLDRQLATRYRVLTGVTREVHVPPEWTARVEELEEEALDRLLPLMMGDLEARLMPGGWK